MPSVRAFHKAGVAPAAALAAGAGPAFPEGQCAPAKAETLVGKAAPSDAEVSALTGARAVRRIAPGAPVTLDHRPDRITLEIARDEVVHARCG
jgi:hypothetical protein